MTGMFRRARELLERLRAEPASWASLDYVESRGEDGEQHDEHEADRAAVLLALQYDRRPEDAGLLRHVLAQEVLCHEDSELQGLMESLPLACYLVGCLRAPEDVVWLARAKAANFDTECGLSRELLFGAGVAETIAHARGLGEAGRWALAELEHEGAPLCSQAEVDGYWRAMAEYYPASPAEEHPLTLAAHAALQDEAEEAVASLERWLADAERVAEAADRTVAIDARWAGQLAADIRGMTEDAEVLARVAAIEAGTRVLRGA
jgi:hypothetical protein